MPSTSRAHSGRRAEASVRREPFASSVSKFTWRAQQGAAQVRQVQRLSVASAMRVRVRVKRVRGAGLAVAHVAEDEAFQRAAAARDGGKELAALH
jgi:hypothetical protein